MTLGPRAQAMHLFESDDYSLVYPLRLPVWSSAAFQYCSVRIITEAWCIVYWRNFAIWLTFILLNRL